MSIDIDGPLPRADRSTRGGQQAISLIVGSLAHLDAGTVPAWTAYRSRPGDPTPCYDETVNALGYDHGLAQRFWQELRARHEHDRWSIWQGHRRYPALATVPIPSRPLSYSAHTRKTDPDTSRQAARTVADPNKGTYARILFLLEGHPSTDEELFGWYHTTYPSTPISPSGLRSRRNELTQRGLIVDSGQRRKSNAGRNSIVWRPA